MYKYILTITFIGNSSLKEIRKMRVKYSFESILISFNFLSNAMEGAKNFTYTSNSLFTHCFEVD